MKLVWLIALTIDYISFSYRLTNIEKALDIERQPLSASISDAYRIVDAIRKGTDAKAVE